MNPYISTYYILPFNESIKVSPTGGLGRKIYIDDGPYYCFFFWDSSMSEWSQTMGDGLSIHEVNLNGPDFELVYTCSCLLPYSSSLIDSFNAGSDDFFLNRQEILVPIMEKAPLAKVMEEILEILPVVLMTIVGLIGLRKALKFLLMALRRS